MVEIARETGIVTRILKSLPIIGFAIRCAETEATGHLMLLLANVLMAAVVAVLIGGFPAFLIVLYAGMGVVALFIFLATTAR